MYDMVLIDDVANLKEKLPFLIFFKYKKLTKTQGLKKK
jgi:hypothetical protein